MLASCRRLHPQSIRGFRASYATVRSLRKLPSTEPDEIDLASNDFFLSIVQAKPSLRDTKSYLASFQPLNSHHQAEELKYDLPLDSVPVKTRGSIQNNHQWQNENPLVSSILNPVYRRTALVKLQGPFTDRQLESIARGLVYLEKLGLVSVIIVELDSWIKGEEGEKKAVIEETIRVVAALEKQGARARPLLSTAVRLGPKLRENQSNHDNFHITEAHTYPSDLLPIRSALSAGEIPVLPPLALDSFCRSVRIHSNDVIGALAREMVECGNTNPKTMTSTYASIAGGVDLTPLRLMIINREGGIPSYARSGLPHLLINLTAEYSYINETFHESWKTNNPSSLANLRLARTCLSYMPPSSSAIMVSHRSSRSLIANLITNRPEVSSSLPHALLQGNGKLTNDTPTILRRGLPIRVVKSYEDLDKKKLKLLLEQSFKKPLNEDAYFKRLKLNLDFAIIAGDYAGAVIVTSELTDPSMAPITYLDKFAVLPSHQGDGTVDFLWVALHDESYGLGLSYSVNPNGGKEGEGEGRDLVWRSRADNPVNKWYFERSTGHLRMNDWIMFWCDAEKRIQAQQSRSGKNGLSYLETWEGGRLNSWAKVVFAIPSCWKPKESPYNPTN